MARKGFSTTFDAETTACARGTDMDCSPKASRNIARTIKGMKVEQAKTFLEEVIAKKTPVPYTVRFRKIKHRKGQGFGPGAYPVKAASKALSIVVNAENNAEYKGLETDDLRVVHASAYQGSVMPGYRPRAQGRATPHFNRLTNLEIVLGTDERLDAREEAKAEGRAGGKRRRGAKEPKATTNADKASATAVAQTPAEESAEKTDKADEAAEKKEA